MSTNWFVVKSVVFLGITGSKILSSNPSLEDITNAVDELIVDDETANEFKHLIPRMEGGGRGLKQHYNYICRWCHQDKIAGGQAGRFLEFRNLFLGHVGKFPIVQKYVVPNDHYLYKLIQKFSSIFYNLVIFP